MKKSVFIPLLLMGCCLYAQDKSLDLQKKPVFDPAIQQALWSGMATSVQVSFANSNTRYAANIFPDFVQQNSTKLVAWKGEKLNAQIVVLSKSNIAAVKVTTSDLKSSNGSSISKSNISTGFVGYVITDEFRDGCGYRKPEDFDSSLVADPINEAASVAQKANTLQPIWVSINVPANIPAGTYTGTISVKADKSYSLKLTVQVLDKTLPPPAQWKFSLDFWQHPAAIARVHNVKLWSDAHFAAMKKYYTMLAGAGQ